MPEQARIPGYLEPCEVLKIHDDGDVTIMCRDKGYVVTTEGEVFKEVKARPTNWPEIKQDLAARAPPELKDNLEDFIELVADAVIKGLH